MILNDKMYADMKACDEMLPKVIGSISALSNELENAKQALPFPKGYDLQYAAAWTTIDTIVCRLRELTEEYDNMIAEQKEG